MHIVSEHQARSRDPAYQDLLAICKPSQGAQGPRLMYMLPIDHPNSIASSYTVARAEKLPRLSQLGVSK